MELLEGRAVKKNGPGSEAGARYSLLIFTHSRVFTHSRALKRRGCTQLVARLKSRRQS